MFSQSTKQTHTHVCLYQLYHNILSTYICSVPALQIINRHTHGMKYSILSSISLHKSVTSRKLSQNTSLDQHYYSLRLFNYEAEKSVNFPLIKRVCWISSCLNCNSIQMANKHDLCLHGVMNRDNLLQPGHWSRCHVRTRCYTTESTEHALSLVSSQIIDISIASR